MGLASSQARLLSLTSRQHTIEASAQRLLSEKMRLSNDSDAAYQKYMDVLEDTTLKTRQIDDLGQTFWIDGNINNLMRYNADTRTAGSVFYVQDLESGKLYVPQDIFNKYNNLTAATVPAGHEYSDAMKYATLFGLGYDKVDKNIDIKINYDLAVSKGWNTALTDEQYNAYIEATSTDNTIQDYAKILKNQIPNGKTNVQYKDINGNVISNTDAYKIDPSKEAVVTNYENLINKILGSEVIKAAYADTSIAGVGAIELLQESLNLLKTINPNLPQARTREEIFTTPELPEGVTDIVTVSYDTTKLSAGIKSTDSDGKPVIANPYIKIDDGSYTFSEDQKFEMMLNGGTIMWEGIQKIDYTYHFLPDTEGPATPVTTDIYSANTNSLLAQRGATDMATALRELFDKMVNCTKYSKGILASYGKTEADVANYRKFKEAAEAYVFYKPEYEYIPTDNVKANYYETLFNSIKAAGGCIAVNEETAKNSQWVENMIKNAKVILTTWDNNEMTLSRTSPSLHVDVKEISDDKRVAQAESDYEAETAFINEKDTKIDNVLSKLETERTTITTEIQGIEKVMKDNVSVNFKVFS